MVQKKIPLRKCTGCGEMFPKKELIRVICTPEKEVMIDLTGKKNGRGCYICRKQECLDLAIKHKAISRSLSIEISDDVISSLRKELGQL